MPGIFSKSARPLRPGAYFDWAATPQQTVLPNIGSVVFLPVTHDWGPLNTVVPITSFAQFQATYGPTTTTTAYRAVKGAFMGEGLPGLGGAGEVLVYRMGTASAAAASLTLLNTAGTPAPALTLTAKYPGTYGQNLSATIQVNALDNTRRDLVLLLNGTVIETYTYAPTDIVGLAALVNTQSRWVTAVELVTGVGLATITGTAFGGGNDGTSLLAADWTAMMTVAGTQRFSLLAPFDLTDSSILASLKVWSQSLNNAGKRFLTVVGGAINEAISDAVTRSASLNDPNFVNLGVGGVVDAELGVLSTSQLAPRIAGILAARGEDKSLTFARLANTTAYNTPTESAILQAFNGGVVVISQDSNPASPVRIEKGLTTYTGGDSTRPYTIYRNPKFVRTMHGIELDLTEWAASNAVGVLQVNNTSRAFVVGYAKTVIDARAKRGVIQPGFTVNVDPDPPPSDYDEFIGLVYGIAFGRSVEQVFNLVYIS